MILTNYLFLGKTVSKQTNMKRSHAQKGGRLQLNQSTHAWVMMPATVVIMEPVIADCSKIR